MSYLQRTPDALPKEHDMYEDDIRGWFPTREQLAEDGRRAEEDTPIAA